MTWGEIAATQREGNGQAKKESRYFALTSAVGLILKWFSVISGKAVTQQIKAAHIWHTNEKRATR